MDLWSELPTGPALRAAVRTVAHANGARYRSVEPMTTAMADPTLADLLPHLGYTLKPQVYQSWATQGPPLWWDVDQFPFTTLRTQLERDLSGAIERTMQDDGQLSERLTTERVTALWTAKLAGVRSATTPVADADAPYYLAWALAGLPGPAWQTTPDGSSALRTLPAWPFRFAPTAETLPLQLQSLLVVDLISWVVLPANTPDNPSPIAEIVHISGVGSTTKLRNFANAFHNNRREVFRLPDDENGRRRTMPEQLPARRLDGPGNYDGYYAGPLATSGRVQLVLNHASVNHPRVGKPFLYLTGLDGLPYFPWFLQQLDIASPFPVDPAWAAQVWTAGLKHGCIVELPARGVRGFWVRSDDPTWDRIISRCAGGTGDEVAEAVGSVETTRVTADDADDDADDADEVL